MAFVPTDPVLARWHRLLEGFQASPRAFYARVEELIERRQIPRVTVSRIQRPEAGALSSVREYLRLERLGYRFDVCAAPFGSGFFVSWWLLQPLPVWYEILVWYVASIVIGVVAFGTIFQVAEVIAAVATQLAGSISAFMMGAFAMATVAPLAALIGAIFIVLLVYHLALSIGVASVQTIQAIVVLGPLYIRIFNPLTYYLLDTAQMFQDAAHSAVMEALDQVTEGKGVRAMTELEREPVMYELPGA